MSVSLPYGQPKQPVPIGNTDISLYHKQPQSLIVIGETLLFKLKDLQRDTDREREGKQTDGGILQELPAGFTALQLKPLRQRGSHSKEESRYRRAEE